MAQILMTNGGFVSDRTVLMQESRRLGMKRLAIIGLVLTIVGLVLAVGYWPLTTLSGSELAAARDENTGKYPAYPVGSRITIHERVLNVDYSSIFGTTLLELDDGDPSQTTSILVRGDATSVVRPNDVIYTSAVLQEVTIVFTFLVWEVPTPADIHPSWSVEALFYGVMAAGVAVLAYAALRKK